LQYLKKQYGYNGEAYGMANYFSAITKNAVSFLPQNNIIIGPITVPCSGTTNSGASFDSASCSQYAPYGWQEAADRAAQAQGINLANYPHRIIMMPANPQCPWIGLGMEACAPYGCVVWINRDASNLSLDEMAHELGECVCQVYPFDNQSFGTAAQCLCKACQPVNTHGNQPVAVAPAGLP
jgi:hypothetical protein